MEYKSYTTIHPKSVEQQEKESKIAQSVESQPRGKQFYVGNLTWVRVYGFCFFSLESFLSRNLQVSYLGSILVYLSLKPSLTGMPPSFQLWYRLHEVGLIIVELFMLKKYRRSVHQVYF